MIDFENNEMDSIGVIESVITDSFIEQLGTDSISLDDEMLTSFVAVVLKTEKHIDLLKAIGLSKFRDDRETCLKINDFCGFLKDMRATGEKQLRS